LFGHVGLFDEGPQDVDVSLIVAFVVDWCFEDKGLVAQGSSVENPSKTLYPNIAFANVGMSIQMGTESSF
jgi:hypothetical protein